MATITRDDPRYVGSEDPRALLRAWGGPDGILDMGGWTEDDPDALLAAAQHDSLAGGGALLTRVVVERKLSADGADDRPVWARVADYTAADQTPQALAAWLAHHDLSPERLADRLGVSRATVYNWLQGRHAVPAFLPLALETLAARPRR